MRRTLLFVLGFVSLLLALLLGRCVDQRRSASPGGPKLQAPQEASEAATRPGALALTAPPPTTDVATEADEEGPEDSPPLLDPYAEAEHWCEPTFYDVPCTSDADCADIDHVAQRPLRCGRPWWSKREDLRDESGRPITVCLPGYGQALERAWRGARLREIVARAYFAESEHCPAWTWERPEGRARFVQRFEDGQPVHRQHWRCQREWARAEKLAGFLEVPYGRETTRRPWKRHRLERDVRANRDSWVRHASTYGWIVEIGCSGGRKRCRKHDRVIVSVHPDPQAKRQNPYYGDRLRWKFGLGPYGKNAALGVMDWDLSAPPEVLCLEVQGTEAYLRDARHAVEVFRGSGVECSGATYRGLAIRTKEGVETQVREPSWIDVHRVASGGKFCPQAGARAERFQRNFRAALERRGIDPDEPVTLEMLGTPLPKDRQNERAFEILARVDAQLPPPF